MANPGLKAPSEWRNYSYGLVLPTADTFENVLGNMAGSNTLIEFDLWLWSNDLTADWKVAFGLYDQDGLPINDNTGVNIKTTGTDTVAGSNTGGPTGLPIIATAGLQVCRRMPLLEDRSLVIKPVGANSGNKVGLWLAYTVWSQ